jgi:hypothetical protein
MRVFAVVVLLSAIGGPAGPALAQDQGQAAAAGPSSQTQRSRACVGPVCVGLGRTARNQGSDAAVPTPPSPANPTPTDVEHQGVGDEAGCIRTNPGTSHGGGGGGTVNLGSSGGGSSSGGLTPIQPSGCAGPPAPIPHPF